jgi:HEAT repeat protein
VEYGFAVTLQAQMKRFGPLVAVGVFLQQVGVKPVWMNVGKGMSALGLPPLPWLQTLITGTILAGVSGILYYVMRRILHDAVTSDDAAKARKRYLEALRESLSRNQNLIYIPLRGALPGAPADTGSSATITDAFEYSRRRLLILGPPGSGKTTSLKYLAWELIDVALEDPEAPIPMLLRLPKLEPRSLAAQWWKRVLPAELQRDFRRYALRQWIYEALPPFRKKSDDLIHYWMDEENIAWLLDGLDEVPEEKTRDLIGSVFKEVANQAVAVSSRHQLRHPSVELVTVALQPLSDADIESYLQRASAVSFMKTLQSDTSLHALAQNPFFLSVMAELSRSADFRCAAGESLNLETLFESYVSTTMMRLDEPGGRRQNRFRKQQVYATLGWLAALMAERQATTIGRAGLAELLGRSAKFPATGLSLAFQAAAGLIGIMTALCLTLVLEYRFGTFGGFGRATQVALTVGLSAAALMAPVRIAQGATQLASRLIAAFSGRVNNEQTPKDNKTRATKSSPETTGSEIFGFLARSSVRSAYKLQSYFWIAGTLAALLVSVCYAVVFVASIGFFRTAVQTLWLHNASAFQVSAFVAGILFLTVFAAGPVWLLVGIGGAGAVNALAAGSVVKAALTLLLASSVLTGAVIHGMRRPRKVTVRLAAIVLVTGGLVLLLTSIAITFLPRSVPLSILTILVIAGAVAGVTLQRSLYLCIAAAATAAVTLAFGPLAGAGSIPFFCIAAKKLSNRFDLTSRFSRLALSPPIHFFLWVQGVLPFHWKHFRNYAEDILLLTQENGEVRFQHALFQDYFLSCYNKARIGSAKAADRAKLMSVICLEDDPLAFSRACFEDILRSESPEMRTGLLARLMHTRGIGPVYRTLILSQLDNPSHEVSRMAAGAAYVLSLDPTPEWAFECSGNLITLLQDSDPVVRAAGARFLAAEKDPKHLDEVRALFHDSSDLVRLEAVAGCGLAEPCQLLQFSGWRDLDVHLQQELMYETLSALSGKPPLPPLVAEHIKVEMAAVIKGLANVDVHLCALQVLECFHDDESRQTVEEATRDRDLLVRVQAWAVLASGDREREEVNTVARDARFGRQVVASLYKQLREFEMFRAFQFRLLGGPELEVRLKRRGFWRSVEAAARMLADLNLGLNNMLLMTAKSPSQPQNVRRKALLLLGYIAGQEAVEGVQQLSEDPDLQVAEAARLAVNLLRFGELYPFRTLLML